MLYGTQSIIEVAPPFERCGEVVREHAGIRMRGQALAIHAWIYRLDDGLLRDLGFCVTAPAEVAPTMARAVAALGTSGAAER